MFFKWTAHWSMKSRNFFIFSAQFIFIMVIQEFVLAYFLEVFLTFLK